MQDTMLSRAALAARWDTSTGRLANMACEGKGPAMTKIGSRVLYSMADVLAYEAANRIETAA